MIKLDKYDSQILLLSKCHFDKVLKGDKFAGQNLTRIDGLKAIWAWRCAWRCEVNLEHVQEGFLLGHLVKMLEKLGELDSRNVCDLLFYAVEFPRENWKLGTNRKDLSMMETMIYGCLGKLGSLQVRESLRDGEEVVYEDLIVLEEKDDSFLKIFEEE